MKNNILFTLACLFLSSFGAYAQCGSSGTGNCYTSSGTGGATQAIVVDICPDNPDEQITIDFTAGDKESCCDEVVVYSGIAGSGTGGAEIYNSSAGGSTFSGLSFTSNTGECLSIYVTPDGSVDCASLGGTAPSYTTSCIVIAPPLTTGNDCSLSSPICAEAGSAFVAAPGSGAGNAETGVDFGCLSSGEQNPSWWWIQMATTGSLDIAITPATPTDYDYAIWGPFSSSDVCGSALGAPSDCSFAAGTAPEEANVTGAVGEYFVLLVNDHSLSGVNYTLELLGSSTGTTNCAVVSCAADVGTNNAAASYTVCDGASVSWVSNDDWVDPPAGCPTCLPELGYALYNDVPPASPDPDVDASFSGIYWTGDDYTAANTTGTDEDPLLTGLTPSNITYANNNTIWFVPITMDDGDNDTSTSLSHDQDSDGCFDTGTPIAVTYLNPITISNGSSACTWSETVSGGAVEFAAFLGTSTMYTYDIVDPSSVTVVSGATTTGVITAPPALVDGTYTVNITNDGNNCATTSFNVVLSSCPLSVDIAISDPCNCTNSIIVGGVTYAQETITITPGVAPYSVTAIAGLFDASGVAYTMATATAAISGTTLVGYVPADNTATYSITIADSNGSSDSISGGPCAVCTTPCAADNGILGISGN